MSTECSITTKVELPEVGLYDIWEKMLAPYITINELTHDRPSENQGGN